MDTTQCVGATIECSVTITNQFHNILYDILKASKRKELSEKCSLTSGPVQRGCPTPLTGRTRSGRSRWRLPPGPSAHPCAASQPATEGEWTWTLSLTTTENTQLRECGPGP